MEYSEAEALRAIIDALRSVTEVVDDMATVHYYQLGEARRNLDVAQGLLHAAGREGRAGE